jgi:hypothetical protein
MAPARVCDTQSRLLGSADDHWSVHRNRSGRAILVGDRLPWPDAGGRAGADPTGRAHCLARPVRRTRGVAVADARCLDDRHRREDHPGRDYHTRHADRFVTGGGVSLVAVARPCRYSDDRCNSAGILAGGFDRYVAVFAACLAQPMACLPGWFSTRRLAGYWAWMLVAVVPGVDTRPVVRASRAAEGLAAYVCQGSPAAGHLPDIAAGADRHCGHGDGLWPPAEDLSGPYASSAPPH